MRTSNVSGHQSLTWKCIKDITIWARRGQQQPETNKLGSSGLVLETVDNLSSEQSDKLKCKVPQTAYVTLNVYIHSFLICAGISVA